MKCYKCGDHFTGRLGEGLPICIPCGDKEKADYAIATSYDCKHCGRKGLMENEVKNCTILPDECPAKQILEKPHDPVNHPKHYTAHPSGIECIQITRHMTFNLGNAMKYLWRADLKNGIEDLKKAAWYIADEIEKRKNL